MQTSDSFGRIMPISGWLWSLPLECLATNHKFQIAHADVQLLDHVDHFLLFVFFLHFARWHMLGWNSKPIVNLPICFVRADNENHWKSGEAQFGSEYCSSSPVFYILSLTQNIIINNTFLQFIVSLLLFIQHHKCIPRFKAMIQKL